MNLLILRYNIFNRVIYWSVKKIFVKDFNKIDCFIAIEIKDKISAFFKRDLKNLNEK